MHVACQLQPTKHSILRFNCISSLSLIAGFLGIDCNQLIGSEGLELDAISTRIGGDINLLFCQAYVSIMVYTRFRDDQSFQHFSFNHRMRAPPSQSKSTCWPMPIMQPSPILTPCFILELLPMKLPVPIRTPLLTVAPVEI